MNNWLRIPGFPPPEKQDSVRFHVLKKLSYSNRMIFYMILLAAGLLLQVFTLQVWPGAIFLVCATILTLVRGYDSRVRLKAFNADSTWTQVDMNRIYQIEKLDEKITKWDKDAIDISNGRGFIVFLLASLGLIIASALINSTSACRQTGAIFIADAIILVLPLWFNGIRRILKQDNLRIKIGIIRQLEAYFQTIKKDNEKFNPSLMLAKDRTGKSIPTDCRFTITFDNMPRDFYGIQAQINLNVVEGTSYPYFYCVIAAKPNFGLAQYINKISVPKGITIEFDKDSSAEVIVIRQYTTKTSGYHTKINACKRILERAVSAARIMV